MKTKNIKDQNHEKDILGCHNGGWNTVYEFL